MGSHIMSVTQNSRSGPFSTDSTVSISGYRAWRRGGTPNRKRLTDAQMLALIRAIDAQLKGAYGSPRIVKEIWGRRFPAGKERIERLMRENGIRGRHKRRYKVTTDSKHALPVAPNLLDRNFTPMAPNQAWTADLTYIWTQEGRLYLAIVLDLFNREVVGWSIKPKMTADIVTDALTMAWFRSRPAPGLIHHSDRGSQYAGVVFQNKLREYGMICSMSRKGKLLGQCAEGELLQQPEERSGSWHALRKPRRGHGRSVRLHRGVLQPESSPLHARLQVADSVPAGLDQDLSMGRKWRLESATLEDEKRRETQSCKI